MGDNNKTNGYTRLLIELLEGMFKELYPDDPDIINNLSGWDEIIKDLNNSITPTITNK